MQFNEVIRPARCGILLFGALSVLQAAPNSHAAAAQPVEQRCASLATWDMPGVALKVQSSRKISAGPTAIGPRNQSIDLPEHCLLQAEINPRTGVKGKHYGIEFELRLPTAWNGKFYFQGGGGMDGVVRPAVGQPTPGGSTAPNALSQGYAVASTDAGHEGLDGSFGEDQQARIDYYYAAIEAVTKVAEQILPVYYGEPVKRSYFVGCSNGGRQALMAAQRFPLLFDGIVSGDPAFDLTKAGIAEVWDDLSFLQVAPKDAGGNPILSKAFSNADLKLVSDAVLAKCDSLDGAMDGEIENPLACRFDPTVLTCKGEKAANCLAANQVAALKAAFGGPVASDGRHLYSDWPYDAGVAAPGWRSWKLGTSETAKSNAANMTLGLEATKSIHRDRFESSLDPSSFNFDTAIQESESARALEDATYTALSSFSGHGGKLILFTGMSDPVFSADDLIHYFRQLQQDNGGAAATDAWARLFLVPGMNHCGGGPALDNFDVLSALDTWVEKGQAPAAISAKGDSFPRRSRNLCPFPQYPHYTGHGSFDEAQSFICKSDAP